MRGGTCPFDWNSLLSVNIFQPMEEETKCGGEMGEGIAFHVTQYSIHYQEHYIYRHLAERDLKRHSLWADSYVTCLKQMNTGL